MELQQLLDKNRQQKESKLVLGMGETLKPLDGPTASFQWPCSSRSPPKIPQVMEHTVEVHLRDRCLKEIGERLQANPSVLLVEATINQCHSLKLQL